MITRTVAEDRLALLAHAQLMLDQFLEARLLAGNDVLEPSTDETLNSLANEVMAMQGDVNQALGSAFLPLSIDVLGDHFPLFSKRCLDFHASHSDAMRALLDQGVAYYKGIVQAPVRSHAEAATMTQKVRRLDEKDAQRLRLLDAVYELTDGDSRSFTTFPEAFERAGLEEDDGDVAAHVLAETGLLARTAGYLALTALGVDERERALRNGDRTDYFSAAAVHNVFNIHAPVNVLQAGTQNTAVNATQTVTNGIGTPSLESLLQALHGEAAAVEDEERREEAMAVAKKIETHATRAPLDVERLKKYVELYATITTVVSPTLKFLVEHFGPQLAGVFG